MTNDERTVKRRRKVFLGFALLAALGFALSKGRA